MSKIGRGSVVVF